jgi:hypothetical protein
MATPITKSRQTDVDMPPVLLDDCYDDDRPLRLVVALEWFGDSIRWDTNQVWDGGALWDNAFINTGWDRAVWDRNAWDEQVLTGGFEYLDVATRLNGFEVDHGRKSLFGYVESARLRFQLNNNDEKMSQLGSSEDVPMPGRKIFAWLESRAGTRIVFPLFAGYITTWEENYDPNDYRVNVECYDAFFYFNDPTYEEYAIGANTDYPADRIQKLIDAVPTVQIQTLLDRGTVQLHARQSTRTLLAEMQQVAASDGGVIMVDMDGKFMYLDRSTWLTGRDDSPEAFIFSCPLLPNETSFDYWDGDPVTDDDNVYTEVVLSNVDQETVRAEDRPAWARYGRRRYAQNSLLWRTSAEGQALADFTLALRKTMYFSIENLALYPDAEEEAKPFAESMWYPFAAIRVGDKIRVRRVLPSGRSWDFDLLVIGVNRKLTPDGLWSISLSTSKALTAGSYPAVNVVIAVNNTTLYTATATWAYQFGITPDSVTVRWLVDGVEVSKVEGQAPLPPSSSVQIPFAKQGSTVTVEVTAVTGATSSVVATAQRQLAPLAGPSNPQLSLALVGGTSYNATFTWANPIGWTGRDFTIEWLVDGVVEHTQTSVWGANNAVTRAYNSTFVGRTLTARVRANTVDNVVVGLATSNSIVFAPLAPNPVVNFRVTTLRVEYATFAWDPVADATEYQIFINDAFAVSLPASRLDWLMTSPVAGSTQSFKVLAVRNGVAAPAFSNTITIRWGTPATTRQDPWSATHGGIAKRDEILGVMVPAGVTTTEMQIDVFASDGNGNNVSGALTSATRLLHYIVAGAQWVQITGAPSPWSARVGWGQNTPGMAGLRPSGSGWASIGTSPVLQGQITVWGTITTNVPEVPSVII